MPRPGHHSSSSQNFSSEPWWLGQPHSVLSSHLSPRPAVHSSGHYCCVCAWTGTLLCAKDRLIQCLLDLCGPADWLEQQLLRMVGPVSYTHLTMPTIYSV